MATELFTNEASTTVSAGGTDAPAQGTSQSWTVASSASFPAAVTGTSQFHVEDPAAPSEIMTVTNVSGTTWTVTRGAESTTPVAHAAGFTVQQVITAGFLGSVPQSVTSSGLFGDGSDGACTLDGVATFSWANLVGSTYTVSRLVLASAITVNNGITLVPNGYRIFCTGTFTNNGTVTADGKNASGSGGGANSEAPANELVVGGGGGTGGTGAGQQGSSFGYPPTSTAQGGACIGGAGGQSGNGNAGGAQQSGNSSVQQILRPPMALITGYGFNTNQHWASPGCGGASGGGDNTNAGGGGGGGGGFVAIWTKALVNGATGTMTAKGGNGANGTGGNAGGGGGGGGGVVVAYTGSAWTNSGTMTAAGGTRGTGAGTGANGVAGNAGLVLNVVVQ